MKICTFGIAFIIYTSSSITPAIAQPRLDRPDFFEQGRDEFEAEIHQYSDELGTSDDLLNVQGSSLDWQPYLSQVGNFRVWMPSGILSDEIKILETLSGFIEMTVITNYVESGIFVAAYSDILDDSFTEDPEALFQTLVDTIITDTNFERIHDRSLNFDALPGIDIPGREFVLANSEAEETIYTPSKPGIP
ncbi:MAG: hypothetical protein F6K30_10250 [Cyanothece sp. SIO2G6]|nr:hypothetical protein [Cyanothece sp. SIO2G6]